MKLIKQFDESDCGAACLAMICSHYKSYYSITQIREAAGTDRQGTSLKGMVTACRALALEAKAAKASEKIFVSEFPVPFIAHLNYSDGYNHFVVVYKIKKNKIHVADPAGFFQKYTKDEFIKIWSGYIVMVSPTPDFKIIKSRNTLLKFLPIIKPHVHLICSMAFVSLILSFLGIFSGLYFQFFIDDIVGSKAKTTLHTLSFALVMITVFSHVLTVIRSQFLRIFTLKTELSLSLSYIHHILKLPLSFFDSRKTGEILSRFDDSEKVRATLSKIALGSVLDFIVMLFVGIYLFSTNVRLFLILLLTVPLSSFVVWLTSKFFAKNYRQQMEQSANINSYLVEMLGGIPVIKSLNAQEYSGEEYERRLVRFIDLGQRAWNYGNIKELITQFITGIGGNLIFWIGGYLILKDSLSLGQLISFNTLATYFTSPLSRFIELQPQIQEAMIAADRIGEILELEGENIEPRNCLPVQSTKIEVPIEFENVTFRYGRRRPVFENLSFSTARNHKIAFVGESGCGKSTIMKLLLKFYEAEKGTVKIGGQNINEINTEFLRGKIGYVPQEVYLFSGTIFDNIVMGRSEYSLQDVEIACKRAQAYCFIQNLPEKYYAKISERGSSLSGGERQRIALARALLSKPQILLLDEATSALDTISEREFQAVVDELGDSKMITVTIAHRLSTVVNSDCIFVMDDGKIVEQGTHHELLEKKGIYYKLWSL
ncbi:MAG: peptidase domain-containing ABC transporter [Treponema sp.]|uniref:peptidase domain-containing ABC transporter n=1 Tax=Treponema sp. TaxID=166 RepID=UPI002A9113FE|nr:peptidase domain-containing ABC transporter [Treponema sp.]MDY6396410.1 peptidase domain-containing ABC transporter [Treponema sp.]